MKEELSDDSFRTEDAQVAGAKKQPQQFKALFLKNIRLQSKQIGTNLCQILTPVLCILFTFLIKTLVEDSMPVSAKFDPVYYPVKFNDYVTFDEINDDGNSSRNKLKWVIYDCVDKCDSQMLGFSNGTLDKKGLLGLISQNDDVSYFPNAMDFPNETQEAFTPFFIPTQDGKTPDQTLYGKIVKLSKTDRDIIINKGGLDYMPDGAYSISELTDEALTFDVKVNDMRELQFHRSNGVSRLGMFRKFRGSQRQYYVEKFIPDEGIMELTDMLTTAFIKTVTGKDVKSGYTEMPQSGDGVSLIDTVISLVAVLIFPLSLSLLFPVFLYTVVLEKEEKLIQMMKMNGLKISSYWLVYFIFNLMLSFFTNSIFFLLGYLLTGMRFFYETSGLLIFIVLLGWSLAQIGMAVFFQTFLNKSRSANIIGYLVSIWTSMIGSTLCVGVYMYPMPVPYGFRMFAPFSFCRIMYIMLTICSEGRCFANIDNITDQIRDCIIFLYLNFFFFFFLGTYLFEVVPQEFGVTRSVLFPFHMIRDLFRRSEANYDALEEDPQLRDYINKDEEDLNSKKQRSDLLAEKNAISANPLVINNLRKLYKKEGREGMYPAVRSFNLKVGPKQTFGLLGPNGAGKTTLISMITGMFEPNHGNAWIGGYDIQNNVDKAQLQMGVCPQFDLLWPQLTVEEHLYFYARLKGIPGSLIAKKVENAIHEVKLTKFKNFMSSSLSGGMKRRLSVAISLVGDPKIVFLDEPSTGLDPENRRQLWEVLAKCQKDRAIFITTHMMEEADALCNRIGIITSGVLRTVGPQTTLKKLYGGGYRLTIGTTKQEKRLVDRQSLGLVDGDGNHEPENYDAMQDPEIRHSIGSFVAVQEKLQREKTKRQVDEVCRFMRKNFEGSKLDKQFNGYLIFKVPLKYKVSEIFELTEKMEKDLSITDVAITTSSLEDVFMNVVKQYDSEAREQLASRVSDADEFMSFPENSVKAPLTDRQDADQEYDEPQIKERESVMSGDQQKMMAPKKDPQDRDSRDFY